MAINNWRKTWYSSAAEALQALWNAITTWYASWDDAIDEVSRIVLWDSKGNNSVGYTPNTTTISNNYFSVPETLRLQTQGYKDLGNDTLANAYGNLWTWSSQYDNVANQIWTFYNALANDVSSREAMLANEKYKLAQQLNQDLLNNKDYVMNMFGPEWTLTKEVNKYYTDMWNFLATDAGRQAANIAAQWVHSWASLWAIRAQQNEAYNEAYNRYLQAKEQEINAKQQIASNLINYMSTLRKEYWDTTNQYIIGQYERANDLLNSISTDLISQYVNLAWAQIKTWGSGSWWTSADSIRNYFKSLWIDVDKLVEGAWWTTEEKKETTTEKDKNNSSKSLNNQNLWNSNAYSPYLKWMWKAYANMVANPIGWLYNTVIGSLF